MSRRASRFAVLAVTLLGFVGGQQVVGARLASAPVAYADGLGDAQRNLRKAQDELDTLLNQMGQLDEDYGAAQDKKAQVDADIAVSQAKVDEMAGQLGSVQQVLQDIAVRKFTSSGSTALSPLFSDAASYSAAEQKDALGRLALDTGEATTDDLQAIVDRLSKERDHLHQQQAAAAVLVATLQQKQQQAAGLEQAYKKKLAAAETRFGAAKVQAEADRRAARSAAAAKAAASAPRAPAGGAVPGRGGGGTSAPSPSSPAPAAPPPVVPSVSGRAGVAVAAAYSQLGVPYRFAGETPGVAFDCSGLTKWAWGQAGVALPHQSGSQFAMLPHVPKDQAQPGDLIFYYAPIGHVGIYVGGGQMIHARNTGQFVELVAVHWEKVVGVGRPG